MSMITSDVIFSRSGRPMQIVSKNPETGKVTLERDLDKVQKSNVTGFKNGLTPQLREAFVTTVGNSYGEDHSKQIDMLHKKLEKMKSEENDTDPRLVRYVESELSFLMNKYGYVPSNFEIPNPKITGSA